MPKLFGIADPVYLESLDEEVEGAEGVEGAVEVLPESDFESDLLSRPEDLSEDLSEALSEEPPSPDLPESGDDLPPFA
jgi:hypothetical protein